MAGAISGAAAAALIGDPFSLPAAWDSITISGQTWTGKVEIRGATRWYQWQKKAVRGQEGATNTYQGDKPNPFEIEFWIWTSTQYANWLTFSQLFRYNGGIGNVIPVAVFHPSLPPIGITQIVCDQIGAVEKRSDDLLFSVKVKVHEFRPAILLNATTTPVAAAPPIVVPPAQVGAGASPVSAVLPTQQAASINQAAALGLKTALPF